MQFEVTNRNIIRSATGSVPVRGGERAANPRPAIRPRGPADTDARPARRNRPGPSASGGSGCGAAPRLGSRPGPFPPRSQAAVSCVRPRLHPSARQPYAAGNSHLPAFRVLPAARAARSGRAAPRLGSRPGPFPPRSQAAVSCVRPRLHPSARQPYAAGNSHLPAFRVLPAARAARSGRAALAAPLPPACAAPAASGGSRPQTKAASCARPFRAMPRNAPLLRTADPPPPQPRLSEPVPGTAFAAGPPGAPSGGNSVKHFRNSVRAAGGSGLIFVP